MQEIDLHLAMPVSEEQFAAAIEKLPEEFGLYVRMVGTLRTYPGCSHWHLGMKGERGTLEVTYWPSGKRAWLAVQAGRRATWIDDLLPHVKKCWRRSYGAWPEKGPLKC